MLPAVNCERLDTCTLEVRAFRVLSGVTSMASSL